MRCIDSSANAIELVERNAARNGVADRVRVERADAVRALKSLRAAGERFGVVVLDPPAFIRRRKDRTKGFEAYLRANGLAIQLFAPGGWLVLASRSAHLEREKHQEIIARASVSVRAAPAGGRGKRAGPRPPRTPRPPRNRLSPSDLLRIRLSARNRARCRGRSGEGRPGEGRPGEQTGRRDWEKGDWEKGLDTGHCHVVGCCDVGL